MQKPRAWAQVDAMSERSGTDGNFRVCLQNVVIEIDGLSL
jgi:hypothetical protein